MLFILICVCIGFAIIAVVWNVFEYDIRMMCTDPLYWVTHLRKNKSKNLDGGFRNGVLSSKSNKGVVMKQIPYNSRTNLMYQNKTKFNNALLKTRHSKNNTSVNYKRKR